MTLAPRAISLIGSPLRSGSSSAARTIKIMTEIQQPVLLIQETADPICSYKALTAQLAPVKPDYFILEEVPGTNHSYDDTELVCRLVENWWQDIGLI